MTALHCLVSGQWRSLIVDRTHLALLDSSTNSINCLRCICGQLYPEFVSRAFKNTFLSCFFIVSPHLATKTRIYFKKRTIENRLDSEKGLEAGRIEQTTTTDNSNINSNNNINMGKAISSFVQT